MFVPKSGVVGTRLKSPDELAPVFSRECGDEGSSSIFQPLRTHQNWVPASCYTSWSGNKMMASWLQTWFQMHWRVAPVFWCSSATGCYRIPWKNITKPPQLIEIGHTGWTWLDNVGQIWRFPQIGVPPVIIHSRLGFSPTKTIHFWVPPFMIRLWKSPCCWYLYRCTSLHRRLVFHRKRWKLLRATGIHLWSRAGGTGSGHAIQRWWVFHAINGGYHKWGHPQNGWFIRENPDLKWMMTGGTPISGNLQMGYPHSSLDGWFHGKSQSRMDDDLGVAFHFRLGFSVKWTNHFGDPPMT